jgi:hypothetical protein
VVPLVAGETPRTTNEDIAPGGNYFVGSSRNVPIQLYPCWERYVTDERSRSSSSDELLRAARQRVLDGELYSDDHVDPPGDDSGRSYDDDIELSAAEIAQQLAEAREVEKPEQEEPAEAPNSSAEEYSERVNGGMSSLPDWALDDDPTHPAPEGPPEATPAPVPQGSLAERIRALADDQGESVTVDIPAGQLQVPPPDDPDQDEWPTPTTEWEARQAARAKKTATTSWIKPVISLVVFAVFGFGFVAAQLDGSEPIDQLVVGDCFDAGDAAEVYSVPVVDCNELHSSELYATVEVAGFDSAYPGDDVLYDWVNARCEEQFSDYVGEPYEDSRYWIEVYFPTEDGWDEGDRNSLCTVVLLDEDYDVRPSLGSAKGWGDRAA